MIVAARRLVKQCAEMPKLDLKAKKLEIKQLLDAFNKDAKRSFIQEHSNKDTLASEVIDSLTDWLNDIWIVVYEFQANFFVRDFLTTWTTLTLFTSWLMNACYLSQKLWWSYQSVLGKHPYLLLVSTFLSYY